MAEKYKELPYNRDYLGARNFTSISGTSLLRLLDKIAEQAKVTLHCCICEMVGGSHMEDCELLFHIERLREETGKK